MIGPVTVSPGGGLTVTGTEVSSGINATGAGFVTICGSKISGVPTDATSGLVVTNSFGPVVIGDPATGCARNTVIGSVNLTGNAGGVVFGSNQVSRGVTVDANSGAIVVKANMIVGALNCTGNSPAPTNAGQTNTVVAGKTGQCTSL